MYNGNKTSFFDISYARKAINTVVNAKEYFYSGPPLIRVDPHSTKHIDIPLMYHNYALDIIHWDPINMIPSPKGRPSFLLKAEINQKEIQEHVNNLIKDIKVVEAAEFRLPENSWVIPLSWKCLIIAHIKVDYYGLSIIPDYRLTEEIKRYVL